MAWRQRGRDTRLARTWMRSMLWHVVRAALSSTVERAKKHYFNELYLHIGREYYYWQLSGFLKIEYLEQNYGNKKLTICFQFIKICSDRFTNASNVVDLCACVAFDTLAAWAWSWALLCFLVVFLLISLSYMVCIC